MSVGSKYMSSILLLLFQYTAKPIFTPGDPCRITAANEPGLCALISRCPAVASRAHTHAHTTCGFRRLEPIVCCPFAVDALPPYIVPVFTEDTDKSNDDLFPSKGRNEKARISSKSMCGVGLLFSVLYLIEKCLPFESSVLGIPSDGAREYHH